MPASCSRAVERRSPGGGRARAGLRPGDRGRRPRSALRRPDRLGDDHRVGVVEAGAERLEQVASRV